MKLPRLSQQETKLLQEILANRRPDLAWLLHNEASQAMAQTDLEAMRETLVAELCETGLGPGDEPNERGLLIETLIGKLRPF